MKYLIFIRGLMEIGFGVYFWFNWATVPNWLIFFVCFVFALEGVNSLFKSTQI